MSFPTIGSSGYLPPELVNNAHFVKYVNGASSTGAQRQAGEGVGMKATISEEELREKERSMSEAFRSGQLKPIQITNSNLIAYGEPDEDDGKTVVRNASKGHLIIETYNPSEYTASRAERSAAAGAPTHAFFYEKTDFLLEAAQEYTALGENEVFQHRNIFDVNFVRNTLDFFTNGNYTQGQENAMQKQITNVVRELAQQLKNGESVDYSKVQTKLTIGGTEVSISQLMDMQKVGRELSESFEGHSSGSLTQHNMQSFAAMGMAKAFGNYYGSSQGEIGGMFSNAISRLYDKGVALVNKTNAWTQTLGPGSRTPGILAAEKLELGIADLFSKIDTSSKSSMSQSFSSTLSQMRSMVRQYCGQYGLTDSYVGLASATDGIMKQFQSWMNQL